MTLGARSSYKVAGCCKSLRGTPLLHPIVPESWDNWVYKGRGGTQNVAVSVTPSLNEFVGAASTLHYF